ncbi:hypothetical protein V1264_002657 [Littorina saxatilis]|uniref:Alpha/beta hydrolase fold-5 domain-containing protein n=2 Tax=Littorina saxatilis TaxID=31220 RepID=A0AAN9B3C1_9CAEN
MCRPAVLFLTVVAVVIVVASVVGAVKPVVIPPTRNATTEAALIIVPAGKISGLAYKPLATTIQHVSSAKLWIVLLTDWLAGFPNPAELPIGVSDATSALKKQGMLSDNVFLAGHSLGGENVAPYGTKHGKKRLKGVLLYGAYMTRLDVPLTDYPVPVMHLSGDLDGRVRITRIADTFQELQQSVSKNQSAMYRTPVVIMRGVNHAQFASGPVPAKMTFYDLKAEVSSATAYQLIANQTAAFITTSLAVPGEDLTNAKNILNSSYSETNAIFEPLLRLKAFDVNTHNSDVWGVSAQVQMSRLSNYSIRVTNQILTSEKDFVTSKPSIDTTSPGTPLVRTLSHVRYVPNPGDLPTFTHSPMYVAVKMKSFAAIHNATHLQPGISTNITCKDINEV